MTEEPEYHSIEEVILDRMIRAEKQITQIHIFLQMRGFIGEYNEWLNEMNALTKPERKEPDVSSSH